MSSTVHTLNKERNRPKGGRGKKNSTVVKRVPTQFESVLDRAINKWYQGEEISLKIVSNFVDTPEDEEACVSSSHEESLYWKIDIQLASEFLKILVVNKVPEEYVSNSCDLYEDPEEYVSGWGAFTDDIEKRFKRWLELGDLVNQCLWQIDNRITSVVIDSYDFDRDYSNKYLISLLAEYGLIDTSSIKQASINELLNYFNCQGFSVGEGDTIIGCTLQDGDLEVASVLINSKQPVRDRSSYWKTYYSSKLQTTTDYWEWLGNPELLEMNSDLTVLLTTPRPNHEVLITLECLKVSENPFDINLDDYATKQISWDDYFESKNSSHRIPLSERLTHSINTYLGYGDIETKKKKLRSLRTAFCTWHNQTLSLLGEDKLKSIYENLYRINWDIVCSILQIEEVLAGEWWEILNVSKNASIGQVKAAYKALCKKHHPDVSKSRYAEENIKVINNAYETYQTSVTPI